MPCHGYYKFCTKPVRKRTGQRCAVSPATNTSEITKTRTIETMVKIYESSEWLQNCSQIMIAYFLKQKQTEIQNAWNDVCDEYGLTTNKQRIQSSWHTFREILPSIRVLCDKIEDDYIAVSELSNHTYSLTIDDLEIYFCHDSWVIFKDKYKARRFKTDYKVNYVLGEGGLI